MDDMYRSAGYQSNIFEVLDPSVCALNMYRRQHRIQTLLFLSERHCVLSGDNSLDFYAKEHQDLRQICKSKELSPVNKLNISTERPFEIKGQEKLYRTPVSGLNGLFQYMREETPCYDISTNALLVKHSEGRCLYDLDKDELNAVYDKAADELVKMVDNGIISFPYQKYFRGDPQVLFNNLKHIKTEVIEGKYRLFSYYPSYGLYMPPKFRGRQILIATRRGMYEAADVLSDFFIENIRLEARRYDQVLSVAECWTDKKSRKNIMKIALNNKRINLPFLRDAIYKNAPETTTFRPTWTIGLLKLIVGLDLENKTLIDISAGWGDRLLAAMAMGMKYTGYDPNVKLRQGHSEMIKLFGDPTKHRVIYEPFETSVGDAGVADVVLSSPPFFTIEEYVPGQEGQSIVSYPDFDQWMVKFLFASLENAWNQLKIGGYLILHLGDSKTVRTCEATNIFIENNLEGASWEGVIGLRAGRGCPRPVWVWKKIKAEDTPNRWCPTNNSSHKIPERTLHSTYPNLYMETMKK